IGRRHRPGAGDARSAPAVHPAGWQPQSGGAAARARRVPPRGAGSRHPVPRRGRESRDPQVREPAFRPAVRAGACRQRGGRALGRAVVTVRVPITEQRDASYDILIGRGLLTRLPALLRDACPAVRYAVITDSHVEALYGGRIVAALQDAKLPVELLQFPAGEWNKTRETGPPSRTRCWRSSSGGTARGSRLAAASSEASPGSWRRPTLAGAPTSRCRP